MLLGIKPTVDFAFKRVFGRPENIPVLIGLLNAILKLAHPIVHVEILTATRKSRTTSLSCWTSGLAIRLAGG